MVKKAHADLDGSGGGAHNGALENLARTRRKHNQSKANQQKLRAIALIDESSLDSDEIEQLDAESDFLKDLRVQLSTKFLLAYLAHLVAIFFVDLRLDGVHFLLPFFRRQPHRVFNLNQSKHMI